MAVIETWFEQDLQKPVKVRYIDGNLFSHNGNGNRIGVIVTNNGDPVTLTGTVSGYAVLADGTTVPCTGSRSGNKASILVPAAAYSPGSILISIFLTDGSTVTTLAALSSSVIMARTGNQIDPGSVVTDWTNTINAAMQSVETAAANLGNIIATPYANLTFPVPLGKYTIYNNGLYRCISPIASSEEWTAAHWTNVKLGDDVAELKNAVNKSNGIEIMYFVIGKYIATNGTTVDINNPTTDGSYAYSVMDCSPGDVFTLKGYGGGAPRLWCFIDSSGNALDPRAIVNANTNYKTFIAPANAAKFIVNVKLAYDYFALKGYLPASIIEDNKKLIEFLDSKSTVQWIDISDVEHGKYYTHATRTKASSSTACILNYEIPVKAGVTYYYRNIYAYYCTVLYDDGTMVALSDTTGAKETGFFTAGKNGKAYITISQTSGNVVTDDAAFCNYSVIPSAGIVGFFDKRLNSVDFNSFVTKEGRNQVPEGNTTFFTQSDNRYDYKDSEDGKQLNSSGDGVTDASAYNTSNYIYVGDLSSVVPLIKSLNGNLVATTVYYALYDSNKAPLAGRSSTSSSINCADAIYIRISISKADKMRVMLYNGSKTPTDYIRGGYFFDYLDSEIKIEIGKDIKEQVFDPVVITPATEDILQVLIDNEGRDIFFSDGNYDIIGIYTTHYGDDFFDNYEGYSGNVIYRGLPVYRGTKMMFSPGAVFTANYTGNNSAVPTHFSAFAFESGVTFDGLRIEASGIRNIIHDDFDNLNSGKTVIKNCILKHTGIIIAGGLGNHDHVIIENNIFVSSHPTNQFDFSYHNYGGSNNQSIMVIDGNYCNKGISLRYYGTSTLQTDVLISNNSMAYDVEKRAENSSATVDNITIRKWNNEIRQ